MKYLFTLIGLLFITNINSQCIAGNCKDGYGVTKYKGDIYRLGYWKTGKALGFEIVTFPTYRSFRNAKGLVSEYDFKSKRRLVMDSSKKKGFIIDLTNNNFFKLNFNSNGKIISDTPLKNNGVEKGCVAGDCKNGIGVFVGPYSYNVGNFVNGNMEGFGYSYLFALGNNYTGEFKNNTENGIGIYYYNKKGDEFYMGEFKDGKQTGKGVKHTKLLKFQAGIFKDGKITKVISTNKDTYMNLIK